MTKQEKNDIQKAKKSLSKKNFKEWLKCHKWSKYYFGGYGELPF